MAPPRVLNKPEHREETKLNIELLGFDAHFEEAFRPFEEGHIPARVSFASRDIFRVQTESAEYSAALAGKLRFLNEHITVGDWVAVTPGTDAALPLVKHLLQRKNLLSRGAAGNRKGDEAKALSEQHLCANVDNLLIVCGLDRDYNLRRIERYAALAYSSGITPVVVLNKADLASDADALLWEVNGALPGVDVVLISALKGDNIEGLRSFIRPGITAALVGSSGAGKSTIINKLLGEETLRTGAVSNALGNGIHTTTHRELFLLPNGGVIIDNPGLREIALSSAGKTGELSSLIDELSKGCRFRDCKHENEPGCAVIRAVKEGALSEERLMSYHKLRQELSYSQKRVEMSAAAIEREKWKPIKKIIRKM
mgnify:CR=1 FL=1